MVVHQSNLDPEHKIQIHQPGSFFLEIINTLTTLSYIFFQKLQVFFEISQLKCLYWIMWALSVAYSFTQLPFKLPSLVSPVMITAPPAPHHLIRHICSLLTLYLSSRLGLIGGQIVLCGIQVGPALITYWPACYWPCLSDLPPKPDFSEHLPTSCPWAPTVGFAFLLPTLVALVYSALLDLHWTYLFPSPTMRLPIPVNLLCCE